MNIDQYQTLASRTLKADLTKEQTEDMAMMGMVGELGELTELFKKHIFHGKELDPARVIEEAGDYLWYITLAATAKEMRLSQWAGLPGFEDVDAAARGTLDEAIASNPSVTRTELTRQPGFFFQLAKAISGALTVPQILTVLAVVLEPFGGLDAAARGNIRKLEARHGLPAGDLDAAPEVKE